MKKLLLALTIITGFAACNSGPEPIEKTGAVQLLPAVAAYNNNTNSDTSSLATPEVTPPKVTSRPTKIVYITRQPAKTVSNASTAPVNPVPAPVTPSVTPSLPGTGSTGSTTAQPGSGGTNVGKEVSPAITQPVKKKGWNNATKGAVIGAGAGAVGGAILSKKKGLGAIIGGVVGAAGGYIIGKNIDKKNAGNLN
jgi:hypothetical protein